MVGGGRGRGPSLWGTRGGVCKKTDGSLSENPTGLGKGEATPEPMGRDIVAGNGGDRKLTAPGGGGRRGGPDVEAVAEEAGDVQVRRPVVGHGAGPRTMELRIQWGPLLTTVTMDND